MKQLCATLVPIWNQLGTKLEPSWKLRLEQEFAADYMQRLGQFLRAEKAAGVKMYPPGSEIFYAFSLTPFHLVKAVILGQDPYHGPGQAHGLSFSVPEGVKPGTAFTVQI